MAKEVYDRISRKSAPVELRDIYLRHGINLTRFSTHEARKLQDILDASNTQIKGIITKAKGVETKEKYKRISAEIRRVSDELREKLDRQLEFDFKELAGEEIRFVGKALGIVTDYELPAPEKIRAAAASREYTDVEKIWREASFKKFSESGHETFESYLEGFSKNLYKVWDTNARAGYLAGLTAQQINRSVLGSVKDMDPGQMQALRRSLEMNTRTMVASMAETARDAVYKANERLFSGYQYAATLDSRTCLVCGEDDGKIFKTLEEAPQLPRSL